MGSQATVLVGVTGSIAAYKAADLVSKLVKAGHAIHVIMTREATELVAPLTFATLSRNPVTLNLFEEPAEWKPQHISLADAADLTVIAPATANAIAKLALGLADDALSSIALACQAPLLIAPAMNGKMWLHPATQQNVATLKERGAQFIGPEAGMLACGYEGLGRLWNVDGIVAEIERLLKQKKKQTT
ncbi:MAG: flavoprotein [Verrucomicrobiia bacterium]